MRHANRWDLPKGHVDEGEAIEQCAARELQEETGIDAATVQVDDDFRFELEYSVLVKEFDGPVRKRLTIFLGWLPPGDVEIRPTEHLGFQWYDWKPPHKIQTQTIDPLLQAVAEHFQSHPESGPSES